jgi:hypothetical protein
MAFGKKTVLCLTQQFCMRPLRPHVDNARLQLIRCQSIVAEKLVYSEYGDAAKVVRVEKENLPAAKDNEVSTFTMRG